MSKQKSNWLIITFLLLSLTGGLIGCSGQSNDSAAPADERAAVDAASTVTSAPSQAAAATPTSVPATATPMAAATATAGAEEVTIDFTTQTGLETLAAYRSTLSLDFEGTEAEQPTQGQANVLTEFTREPEARHTSAQVEGNAFAELGGSATFELYTVDNVNYMQIMPDTPWLALPAGEVTGPDFVPEDFMALPTTARRSSQAEKIQGLAVEHYSFTEADLADPNLQVDSAQGEMWVAAEGGYIVKYEIEATISATDATASPEANRLSQAFDTGSIHLTYELADINDDLTITLPEEAAAAGRELAGLAETPEVPLVNSLETTRPDLPLPADAQEVEYDADFEEISFTSPSEVATLVEFYRQELMAQGWQEDEVSALVETDLAFLDFEKGDASLSFDMSSIAADETEVYIYTTGLAWETGEAEAEVETINGFPVLDDVYNLHSDGSGAAGFLRATSFSDMTTVLEFYRRELAALGWQENTSASTVGADQAEVVFEDHGVILTLTLSQTAGEQTDLEITTALAEGGETTLDMNALPLPPGAEDFDRAEEAELIYGVAMDLETVLAFYRQELTAQGWQASESGKTEADNAARLFTKDNFSLGLNLLSGVAGQTSVFISLTAEDQPDMVISTSLAERADPLVNLNDVPVLPDAEDVAGTQQALLTYAVASDLETVLEFYRQELSELGWRENTEAGFIQEGSVSRFFEQGGFSLNVVLFKESENQTGAFVEARAKMEVEPEVVQVDLATLPTPEVLATSTPAATPAAGATPVDKTIWAPLPGRARIYLGNFSDQAVIFTLNGQEIKVEAGVGAKQNSAPEDLPFLDLDAGTYAFRVDIPDAEIVDDEIKIGPDESWGIIALPTGGYLPGQFYP